MWCGWCGAAQLRFGWRTRRVRKQSFVCRRFFYRPDKSGIMNDTIQRIDEMIEERSLLKHQFYQMWSAGELTRDALAGYSKEYFQLVKAIPTFMDTVISHAPAESSELTVNRQEELEHIEPWKRFASHLGVHDLDQYEGLSKTKQAVQDLSLLMDDYVGGSCAMYALEKEIPAISITKLDGLDKFYNITDSDATAYFRLHAEADVRHAATWKNIIESTESGSHLDSAQKSLSAQNLLLDSCYEAYC